MKKVIEKTVVEQLISEKKTGDEISKRLYKDSSIYLDRKFNKFAALCRNI